MKVVQANLEERLRALRSALATVAAGTPAATAYEAAIKRILAEKGGAALC